MGTFVPTLDIVTAGGTLGIGTTNASTINIGNQESNINVNNNLNLTGTMNFSNLIFYSSSITTDSTNTGIAINYGSTTNISTNDIAIGTNALNANSSGYNIAIGTNTLDVTNTSGQVAIGYNALAANTTGSFNTAVGTQCLDSNTTGTYNTAVGYQALDLNTTGIQNTAIGYQALKQNLTTSYHTAIGTSALYNCVGNGTNGANVAIGQNAGKTITSGYCNTAVGTNAMNIGLDTTLQYSTAIGCNATCANNSNSTAIGTGATCTANNQIMLGTIAETVVVPGVLNTSTTIKTTNPGDSVSLFRTNTGGINIGGTGSTRIYGNATLCYWNASNFIELFADPNTVGSTAIDFHCTNVASLTDYDARILCAKSANTGTENFNASSTLAYYALGHYFFGGFILNNPITLNYTTTPASSQLGYIVSGTTISTTIPTTNGTLSTMEIPYAGIWNFFYHVELGYATIPTACKVFVSGVINNTGFAVLSSGSASTSTNSVTASVSAGNYNLVISYTGGQTLVIGSNGYFKAVRIA